MPTSRLGARAQTSSPREPPTPTGHRRILLLPSAPSPWKTIALEHGWSLATTEAPPDVVVCLEASSKERAAEHPRAAIVHVTSKGRSWASEGADIVLFSPTEAEFIAACDRALHISRARALAADDIADVLECIQDAFFVVDWDGRIVYQNRPAHAFVARLEGGSGDVVGELLTAHVPPAFGKRLGPALDAMLHGVEPPRIEIHEPDPDSWTEIHGSFIPSGAAIQFRDVTLRRRAEAAFLGSMRALYQHEKLASMDMLAKAVAAQLGSVLALGEEARGDGLRDIVARLEASNMLATGARGRVDVVEAVQAGLRIRAAMGAKGVRIDASYEGRPAVVGDFGQLDQLVVLLLQLAEASVASRQGHVQVAVASDATSAILMVEGAEGPDLTVDVDAGSPELSAKRDASDLGLWVARAIVHEHGGTMTTQSRHAARFTVCIPLAPEAAR